MILLGKKFLIVLLGLLLCLVIFYTWDNILILDDSHPNYYTTNVTNDSLLSNPEKHEDTLNETSVPKNTKGFYIHINLDELKMYIYKNGQFVKSYPVSGGKPNTPSPVGTWKIINKDTWGEGFGGAWLGFNVPWGKYGIHGTIYPWFIGKSNSSKGCIRMNNKDVADLYKLVPHGTTVNIVHSSRVFRVLKSGDVGSDVLEVQKCLKGLGYYNGYPDGVFGNGLANGIRKFQKDNKLWVSGTITKKTYTLLIEKHKQKNEQTEKEIPNQSVYE